MRTLTAYNEDNFRQIEQYKGCSSILACNIWKPPYIAKTDCRPARWRYSGGESQCRSGAGADNQIRDLGAAVCADIS